MMTPMWCWRWASLEKGEADDAPTQQPEPWLKMGVSRDYDGGTENKFKTDSMLVSVQCRFRNEQGLDVRTDDE